MTSGKKEIFHEKYESCTYLRCFYLAGARKRKYFFANMTCGIIRWSAYGRVLLFKLGILKFAETYVLVEWFKPQTSRKSLFGKDFWQIKHSGRSAFLWNEFMCPCRNHIDEKNKYTIQPQIQLHGKKNNIFTSNREMSTKCFPQWSHVSSGFPDRFNFGSTWRLKCLFRPCQLANCLPHSKHSKLEGFSVFYEYIKLK